MNAASVAAAPPRSVFIPGMPPFPLICNPPVSNVTPLPTSATFRTLPGAAPVGRYLTCTSAGSRPSRAAASPTATNPPNPFATNLSYRSASKATSAPERISSIATSAASPTKASGSMTAGGVSTTLAASRTALAVCTARFTVSSSGVSHGAVGDAQTSARDTAPLSAILPRSVPHRPVGDRTLLAV